MGESDRPDFLLAQLENMNFTSDNTTSLENGSFRLSGNAQDMIGQMLTYQGTRISGAYSDQSVKEYAYAAVESRMTDEYGVNIDEEMARLMELQNSYAASARVVSVVQELIDALMQI